MRRKILAVASGGGHWVQLRRLSAAFEDFEVVYVSVKADYAHDVPGARYRRVHNVTRFNKQGFPLLALQMAWIVLTERPAAVITTGAAPGLMALIAGRFLAGARTIWIDSIANCERMSGSGQLARRVADAWLTQWPQLAGPGGPQCWGAVI